MSQLSIKTRIETPEFSLAEIRYLQSLSQLSIKTRIETKSLPCDPESAEGLSQLSIKTRIETDTPFCLVSPCMGV